MIRAYSFTAPGDHPVNEDAFLSRPDGGGWVVALADGQGGRSGGRRAAEVACRVALERFALTRDWPASLAEADARVAADPAAGFTTLVGLSAQADRVSGASCGDSAAVAAWGDGLMQVLTSRQRKDPPVGTGEAAVVPFALALAPPWRVLVMSDGVWKYAGWDRVWASAARLSGEELLADLRAAAHLRATGEYQDDFTAVLLESE